MVILTVFTLLMAISVIIGIILLFTCGATIIPVVAFMAIDVLIATGIVYLIILFIRFIRR